MTTLFSYNGSDNRSFTEKYQSFTTDEFYDGEFHIDRDQEIDFILEKVIDYPVTITKLRARNQMGFRRNWNHIRANNADIHVVTLLKRGEIHISNSSGTHHVAANSCAIHNVSKPYVSRFLADDRNVHESVMLYVPAHLFKSRIGGMSGDIASFSLSDGHGLALRKLLDYIIDDLDRALDAIPADIISPIVDAFLTLIQKCLTRDRNGPHAVSVIDRRYQDVRNYIMKNLTDTNLSANTIAAACGISPRYLCHIFKAQGRSFSDLVWNRRLEIVKHWLGSPSMRNYLVGELAQMAGYKSSSHFSRAFKASYGCAPTEYRERQRAAAEDGGAPAAMPTIPDHRPGSYERLL